MSRATALPTDAETPFDAQESDDGFADTDDAVVMPAPGVINDPRSFKCACLAQFRLGFVAALIRDRARARRYLPPDWAGKLIVEAGKRTRRDGAVASCFTAFD